MVEELRDELAKAAMAALLREGFLTRLHSTEPGGHPNDYRELARRAYAIADAMIAIRGNTLPQELTNAPSPSS
jgi:hypothetical protein